MLTAQVCHAAGESSPGNLPAGTYAVVLAADKQRLELLEHKLQLAGLPHRSIRENDPPYSGELLAIGICPALKKEVKHYVSDLALVK
jgi:peptidyl-tRNA hydrolase